MIGVKRDRSPCGAASILIISAPRSAIIRVRIGMAIVAKVKYAYARRWSRLLRIFHGVLIGFHLKSKPRQHTAIKPLGFQNVRTDSAEYSGFAGRMPPLWYRAKIWRAKF